MTPVFSAIGTAGIIFAYTGFRSAIDYSGEAKNPRKDIPRAIIFSVLTTIALYTMLQVVFIGGVRWNSSGIGPGDWAGLGVSVNYSKAPFFELMSILGVSALAIVLLVDAIISPLGTTTVYAGSSSRDLYALAEGGSFDKLSEVHSKHGVPRLALFTSLAIGVGFVFAFPNWSQLATIATSAAVFSQLAGGVCLTVLRKNAPSLGKSFRVPFLKVFAPLAFVMSSFMVYWITWPYTGYSLLVFMSGILLYFISRKRRGSYRINDIGHGLWIVAYSIVLAALSYLGSYGIDLIHFPDDFVVVGVSAIIFFYLGVLSGYKTKNITMLLRQEEVESDLQSNITS